MDLIQQSIERLKLAAETSLRLYHAPLIVTTSGGKDSSVCVELAQRAGIEFEIQHNHTTADATFDEGIEVHQRRRAERSGGDIDMSAADLLDSIPVDKRSCNIESAVFKAWGIIHFPMYDKILVSVSGGSDSDIMIDLIERIGHPGSEVHYAFYNTGIEFAATKKHLDALEQRYGITIGRYKAKLPVPIGVKKYGIPFLSKRVSQYIHRLQLHDFRWEDKPFEELNAQYRGCKAALRWWCNEWGEGSQMNISRNKWLKEFLIANPPDFPISDGCCNGAKKATAKAVEQLIGPDLNCQGVRRAEGGARATVYTSCFDECTHGCDRYRPVYWFTDEDKKKYEDAFGIVHSDCYTIYGLTRTGCACCPFGRDFEAELAAALKYETALYRAAINVFGKSYEYTRRYRQFCQRMGGLPGQQTIFGDVNDGL